MIKFLGRTDSVIFNGWACNPIVVNGRVTTARAGDVVYDDYGTFVYDGSKWQALDSTIEYYNAVLEKIASRLHEYSVTDPGISLIDCLLEDGKNADVSNS